MLKLPVIQMCQLPHLVLIRKYALTFCLQKATQVSFCTSTLLTERQTSVLYGPDSTTLPVVPCSLPSRQLAYQTGVGCSIVTATMVCKLAEVLGQRLCPQIAVLTWLYSDPFVLDGPLQVHFRSLLNIVSYWSSTEKLCWLHWMLITTCILKGLSKYHTLE